MRRQATFEGSARNFPETSPAFGKDSVYGARRFAAETAVQVSYSDSFSTQKPTKQCKSPKWAKRPKRPKRP